MTECMPNPVQNSTLEDREYFLKRADDHRRLAEKCDEAGAKSVHLQLENLYKTKATFPSVVDRD